MTAERKELTGVQTQAIADALGLENGDERVWCLAIDPRYGAGSADVLAADDVVWFTGADMTVGSHVSYPKTGTIQMTFKRKPGR